MLVSILVASDDATAGSVIRKAERISPSISGRLFLQLLQDRDRLPSLALGVLLLVDRHGGPDMLVHERFHAVEPFALTVRHVEVHWAFLTFLGRKSLAALSPRRPSFARLFLAH